MAFQLSPDARNSTLSAIETAVGAYPILTIATGTAPTECASANTGSIVATMILPADWLSTPTNGVIQLSGSWQDLSADTSGTAGYFRIHRGDGTVCHLQGTISATGAGGDMQLDNTNIAVGQQITITTFTITAGGA